jgi:hypothetical protein
LDGSTLKEVCPLMLYQLESGMCDGVILDSDGKPEIKAADLKKKPSQTEGTQIHSDLFVYSSSNFFTYFFFLFSLVDDLQFGFMESVS